MASGVEVRRVAPGDDAMIKILAEHHAEAFGYRAAPARVAEMQEHAKASGGAAASETTSTASAYTHWHNRAVAW